MRGKTLLLAAVIVLATTLWVHAASVPEIFSYDTLAQAQAAWSASHGAVAIGDDSDFGRYLEFTAEDSSGSCSHVATMDFSAGDVISFMMHMSDHGHVGVVGILFRSGSGYYAAYMEVFGHQRKAAGWRRIMMPKRLFVEQGTVSGWAAIDQMIIAIYPDPDLPPKAITVKLVDFHTDTYTEVGNILLNSSFEYSAQGNMPDDWGNGHWGISSEPWVLDMDGWRNVWTRVTADPYDGQYCMRLINDSAYPSVSLAGAWVNVNDPSRTHTFSAYLKSDSGYLSVTMRMGNFSKSFSVGPGWHRYWVTGVPGVDRVTPTITLDTSSGTLFVDAVMLEIRPSASTYRRFDSDVGLAQACSVSLAPRGQPARSPRYFPTLPSRESLTATSVTIDGSGRFLVNGQPFIPYAFGMEKLPTEGLVYDVAADGFNSMCIRAAANVTVSQIQNVLDGCRDAGLYVILWIDSSVGNTLMQSWITALKSHPALLAWYVMDEPTDPFDPVVQARVDAAHAADTTHPAFVNYIKGRYNAGDLPGDIASLDDYVIPWSCPLRNGLAGKKMVEAVAAAGKPAWTWLQGSGYAYWLDRDPTPRETSCMAYLNLVYGVRGFYYFIAKPLSATLYDEMKTLAAEIHFLSEILSDTALSPTVTVNNGAMHFCVKAHDNKLYLIAVNSSLDDITAEFSGACLTGMWARTVFEERTVPISGSVLTDHFGPYERRVYVLTESNLMDHWPLDGNYSDVAGGRPLTPSGGTAFVTPGNVGTGALSFDGVDDGCTASNGPVLTERFSTALWIKPFNSGQAECDFFTLGSDKKVFRIAQGVSAKTIMFSISPDGTYELLLESPPVLENQVWTHITCTYDGHYQRIYSNGILAASSVDRNASLGGFLGQAFSLAGNDGSRFAGLLDDVRLYDAVLSPAEIMSIVQRQALPIHQWLCEPGADPTVLYDAIGDLDGSLTAGGFAYAPGPDQAIMNHNFFKVLDIDGSGSLNIGSLATQSDFTAALWVKTDAVTANDTTLLTCEDTVKVFRIARQGSTGQIHFQIAPDGLTWLDVQTTPILESGVWTHVACVYDGHYQKIYLNGVLAASSSDRDIAMPTRQALLSIGDASDEAFTGQMDDIRYYNKALTAQQVSQLLDVPMAGTCGERWLLDQGRDEDFNHDCRVDLNDFALFAQNWMLCYSAECY